MWNHEWFWDRAAAYQNNLRFVYLGLTNKQGEYRWLDGTTLGYEYITYENIRVSTHVSVCP